MIQVSYQHQFGHLFVKKLLGSPEVEHLARVVVHPVFDPLCIALCPIIKVDALRDMPPNELVLVLVGSALAAAVRMAVIDLCPVLLVALAPFHPFEVLELRSIINGYRFEHQPEQPAAVFSFNAIQRFYYLLRGMLWKQEQQLFPCLPFNKKRAAEEFPLPFLYSNALPGMAPARHPNHNHATLSRPCFKRFKSVVFCTAVPL